MKRHLGAVLWLTFVWIALWRDMSWANLVAGFVVANGVLVLFPFVHHRHGLRLSPLGIVRFAAVFGRSVITSNLIVAREVVSATGRVKEGIVAVELESSHPVVVTVVNHAINLAPGTFVVDIDVDPTVLYVHCLHLDDPDDVRAEVHHLERLCRAAFGLGTRAPSDSRLAEVAS